MDSLLRDENAYRFGVDSKVNGSRLIGLQLPKQTFKTVTDSALGYDLRSYPINIIQSKCDKFLRDRIMSVTANRFVKRYNAVKPRK